MPTPMAGPGEVRVRLEASGINPADVGRRAGSYRAMEFPRVIPNSDGAGIVDQVGDGVTRLSVGQRVWLFNGQRNGRAFGTAAEYITLAEHLVTPLPRRRFVRGRRHARHSRHDRVVRPVRRRTGRRPDRAGHRRRRRGRPLCRATGEMGRRARDRHGQFGLQGGAGAAGRRRSRDQLQDRGRGRQGDGVYGRARRRSRGRCRFRRQYRHHPETDGDEFNHRGLRHQRQSQPCGADARADGEMHRAARAGAVRAAATVAGGGAGRHLEMARGRQAHPQHRRAVSAVGNRAGPPRGGEGRQARDDGGRSTARR